jgi:5-formyltetrahydrofolate cyclo-ligase
LEIDHDRKLQRERLLALRASMPERAASEAALQRQVADWLVGVVAEWLEAGDHRVAALPSILGERLEFTTWSREAPMRAGEFGIPVPAHGRPVHPDVLFIPCVGFDAARYRLGYGGGYYDRTLARIVPWPLAVGVAFECARLASITPQPHDIQLDAIITEVGVI